MGWDSNHSAISINNERFFVLYSPVTRYFYDFICRVTGNANNVKRFIFEFEREFFVCFFFFLFPLNAKYLGKANTRTHHICKLYAKMMRSTQKNDCCRTIRSTVLPINCIESVASVSMHQSSKLRDKRCMQNTRITREKCAEMTMSTAVASGTHHNVVDPCRE